MYVGATACMYFDEKMMWRKARFEEPLVSPAKTRSKQDGGTPKNEIGFDVHPVYEHVVHHLGSTYES